jgi:two-component system, sensor histidine kinase and response regulator
MSAPRADGQAPTIVIVEDQEAIVEVLSEALTDAGFAPLRAPGAAAAAAFARDVGAAVVLLDVMMPELSGWTVLEQLRADPATRETPVVITSAVYDRPGLHPLPSGGPVRFTPKPFDIAELVATVSGLLA